MEKSKGRFHRPERPWHVRHARTVPTGKTGQREIQYLSGSKLLGRSRLDRGYTLARRSRSRLVRRSDGGGRRIAHGGDRGAGDHPGDRLVAGHGHLLADPVGNLLGDRLGHARPCDARNLLGHDFLDHPALGDLLHVVHDFLDIPGAMNRHLAGLSFGNHRGRDHVPDHRHGGISGLGNRLAAARIFVAKTALVTGGHRDKLGCRLHAVGGHLLGRLDGLANGVGLGDIVGLVDRLAHHPLTGNFDRVVDRLAHHPLTLDVVGDRLSRHHRLRHGLILGPPLILQYRVRDQLGHALVSRLRNQHAWILLALVASQGRLRHHRNRQDRHHTSHQSHSHRCLPPIVSSPARPVFTLVKLLMCQGTRLDSTIWVTSGEWKKYTGCGFLKRFNTTATLCRHPMLIIIWWRPEGRTNGGSHQGRLWRVNGSYRSEFDGLYRGQGAGVNGAAGREGEHRLGEDVGAQPARRTETCDLRSSRTACGDTSRRG